MIETLHMTMEVLADAKVEIFVFILAACVHFLLFSNRLPVKDGIDPAGCLGGICYCRY